VHVRVSPPPRRRAPHPAVLAASRGPGGWWRPGEGAHRPRDSLVREPCSSAAANTRFRVGIGPKRAIFRPFLAAGGAKTRSAPQLRSAAGGDVLFTCPGPNAGRRGRHGGARGRKNENPHFWGALLPLEHGSNCTVLQYWRVSFDTVIQYFILS
jgi:hypothetical protein